MGMGGESDWRRRNGSGNEGTGVRRDGALGWKMRALNKERWCIMGGNKGAGVRGG